MGSATIPSMEQQSLGMTASPFPRQHSVIRGSVCRRRPHLCTCPASPLTIHEKLYKKGLRNARRLARIRANTTRAAKPIIWPRGIGNALSLPLRDLETAGYSTGAFRQETRSLDPNCTPQNSADQAILSSTAPLQRQRPLATDNVASSLGILATLRSSYRAGQAGSRTEHPLTRCDPSFAICQGHHGAAFPYRPWVQASHIG